MKNIPQSIPGSQSPAPPPWQQQVISLFANAKAIDNPITLTLQEFLGDIRGAKYQTQVAKIREIYNHTAAMGEIPKAAVKSLKQALPAATLSGLFTTRAEVVPLQDKLLQHSGILCADLDEIPADEQPGIRAALTTSPHLLAVFLSPTGSGLKALFRVPANAERHKESHLAVESHIKELTRWPIDKACSDPTRLCFVSYDPDLWLREGEAECIQLPNDIQPQPLKDSNSHTVGGLWCCVVGSLDTIDKAVEIALPRQRRQNHRMLMKLAGALLAYQIVTLRQIQDSELRDIFRQWHARAARFLDPKQSEGAYYLEFLDAWQHVKHPLTDSPLLVAWARAQKAPIPPEALARELSDPDVCLLITLCRELQILQKSEPFFLSPYDVQNLFGQKHHTTACSRLSGLCRVGILTKIKPGIPHQTAAEYRYNFAQQ